MVPSDDGQTRNTSNVRCALLVLFLEAIYTLAVHNGVSMGMFACRGDL